MKAARRVKPTSLQKVKRVQVLPSLAGLEQALKYLTSNNAPFRDNISTKGCLFLATFFYACDEEREAASMRKSHFWRTRCIAYQVRMVYTDSLRVKAILTAEEHHDYTNLSLKHSTFPKGLKVVFLDEADKENIILADYGILYNNTGLSTFKATLCSKEAMEVCLKTPQLFWDADAEWIFTEETFNFSSPEYDVVATRLDTNKEFTKFKTGKLTGTVAVQEEESP